MTIEEAQSYVRILRIFKSPLLDPINIIMYYGSITNMVFSFHKFTEPTSLNRGKYNQPIF